MKKKMMCTLAVVLACLLSPSGTVEAQSDSGSQADAVPETVLPPAEEEVAEPAPESSQAEGTDGEAETVSTEEEAQVVAAPAVADEERGSERVERLVDEMTTRQKITHMIMPDFRKWQQDGETAPKDLTVVNEEIAKILDDYDFGGVILFAENVKETKQTLALTQGMQDAVLTNKANNGKIPLFIAIDQEGGIVYRLGSGTALPGNMALGATASPELAKEAGEIIGRELSALGLNVDFAPVLDTNNNPRNPIIGLRSFSSDPNLVAKLGVAVMKGIQAYNVAVSAKHFPGHGDTAVDSHTGLPLVDKSYAELEKLELLPFKIAAENGVDMFMTAHIQYPQIEKDTVLSKENGESIYLPATLSDDILTGIVRRGFGYKGVIVSDAMGMDAIAKNFGESDAAIKAIQAGVDIILMPTVLRSKADLAKMDKIISDIEGAVLRGEIPESRLRESVRRIVSLKEKRGVLDFDLSARTEAAAIAAVGSEENRDMERTIAASAVTVVKNEDTLLPFSVAAGDKVLLLGAYNNELPGLELGMRRLIADGVVPAGVTFESLRYHKDSKMEELQDKIAAATHVIVISEIGREAHLASDFWLTKIPTAVIDYANQLNKPAVVMSISKPYDVANYPAAKAIIAVYGNKGMDPTESLKPDNAFGPNIPAGVEVIFAGKAHSGRLPVAIPAIKEGRLSETETAFPIGYGLSYTAPVEGIQVSMPATVKRGETLPVTIAIPSLNGLEKQPYLLTLMLDSKHFRLLGEMSRQLEGDKLFVHRVALDTSPLTLELTALTEGVYSPISTIWLIDAQGRVFTLGEGYYETIQTEVLGVGVAGESTQQLSHLSSQGQTQSTTSKHLPKTGQVGSWLTWIGLGILAFVAGCRRRLLPSKD